MINCIVLEDEKSAQEIILSYIEKTPFINVVGVFESGIDIPQTLLQKTDLLFLDIQLPEITGLSFLKTLTMPPKVIITTAYPNHALEAFEHAVVDYLVKPFSYERFLKAVNRIHEVTKGTAAARQDHFFIYADKTTYKIKASDILFFKAEVDYVQVVTDDRNILFLDSLRNWEEKLKILPFIRVHRSYIVNLDRIERLEGNILCIDEHRIPIGKKYKEKVRSVFG